MILSPSLYHTIQLLFILQCFFSEQAEAQRQRSKAARLRREERKAQKKKELLALLAQEDEQRK